MKFQQTIPQITSDNIQIKEQMADRVEITYYTDPLCCWGWAFEPQWRRLQYEFRQNIVCRYVMSGLLPTWQNFNDPMYSVSRPMQMGPVWHEASLKSGMEIYDKIWVEDPPASSYPACIAVKCAALQSPAAGAQYLRMAREAVMLQGKNIAKQDILTNIAEELAMRHPDVLNKERFLFDFTGSDNGIEAFRKDLNEVQSRNITRFPTLIMKSTNKAAIMITGYRPYPVLLDAISQVIPAPLASEKPLSKEAYIKFWGSLTEREMEEVFPA
jgi:predicted DsbA family dithiol-disulfide isomerase